MELRYHNTNDDFRAHAACMWRDSKIRSRNSYYVDLWWYLFLLVVTGFVAVRVGDIFAVCIVAGLAATYLGNNYSFRKQWDRQLQAYVSESVEFTATLTLDDHGLTERFLGLSLAVPWDQIREFVRYEERTIIYFLKGRGFIVPDRDLPADQVSALISALRNRGIREKTAQPGATDNPGDAQRLREDH